MPHTAFRLALGLAFSVRMFALSCVEVPPCSRLTSNAVFFRGRVLDAKASLSKRTDWATGNPVDMFDVRYLVVKGMWGIATGQVVTVCDAGLHQQGTVEVDPISWTVFSRFLSVTASQL